MLINRHKLPAFSMKVKPYDHQTKAFEMSKELKRFALYMEQGTGKSKIIIDNVAWLFLQQEIDGLLITTDKSFYLNWYHDEIPTHMPEWMPYRMHYWNADMSKQDMQAMFKLLIPQDDMLDIFIINVEALATPRGLDFAMRFVKMHYTYMVVDEATCIKNHKAARTKGATKLGWYSEYRRILTGTPLTRGPLDLYSQAEFLETGLSGYKNFLSFKSHYANYRRIEFGNRSYEKIESYKNLDELKQKVASFSFRILKSECLDLPEKIFENVYIEHTPEQAAHYKGLKEEALIEFSDESLVTSTSVLTTLIKLHQINCGHVKDDIGNTIRLPNNRIKALLDIVEIVDGKLIVWAYFKEDIRMIIEALDEAYGEGSAVHYYGDTTQTERILHLERFKRDSSCRFFVSNETGSKSLTLVQAAHAIYYSYGYKLETWLQSQDRNHRIGQDKNVTYTSIIIKKTVDEMVMKALRNKRDIATDVLDTWRSLI